MAVDGELAVRTNGGPGDKGQPQHAADIADEVARGGIVTCVHHHVVLPRQLQRIPGQEPLSVGHYLCRMEFYCQLASVSVSACSLALHAKILVCLLLFQKGKGGMQRRQSALLLKVSCWQIA